MGRKGRPQGLRRSASRGLLGMLSAHVGAVGRGQLPAVGDSPQKACTQAWNKKLPNIHGVHLARALDAGRREHTFREWTMSQLAKPNKYTIMYGYRNDQTKRTLWWESWLLLLLPFLVLPNPFHSTKLCIHLAIRFICLFNNMLWFFDFFGFNYL